MILGGVAFSADRNSRLTKDATSVPVVASETLC